MTLRVVLLSGSAWIAAFASAQAADTSFQDQLAAMPRLTASQPKVAEMEPSKSAVPVQAPTVRVARAKKVTAKPHTAPVPAAPSAIEQKIAEQQAQIAALIAKVDAAQTPVKAEKKDQPSWTLANGRPTVTSADGRFSLAVRAIGQFDTAYYSQRKHARELAAANGPDLSSGQNFRRAQFGIQGKVFGDWSYQFNYDFAGSGGTESPGRIQAAWVQYDGLAPFAVRIGAFPPSASLEDNTSAADTLFLERNAPAELARNIAGGDGRDAIAVTYTTDRLYGSLAYTGDKIADAGVFDEQQALVGRFSGLAYTTDDIKLVLSANSTFVFKAAETTSGPGAMRAITFSAPPELTVDNAGTKLVSSGSLNAQRVWQWGLESGAQYKNFFGQAGYFGFNVARRDTAARSVNFGGWYAQASWVITGESRSYNKASAAFANPKPITDFSFDGDSVGAWEVAARYSVLSLNDHAGAVSAPLPVDGIRGGEQRIVTIGLNWYPNSAVRFELQLQHTEVSRIGTIPAGFGHGTLSNADVGQSFNTIALRSQVAF